MPRKGKIRLLMAARLSLEMEHDTIKQMPMGGVSIPMARFATTMAPSWMISIPREGNIAVIMGTSKINAAVVSTNVPATRRIILMSNNKKIGL